MSILNKMKHYNFWVALTLAVLVLLNTLSDAFKFELDEALFNDIVMGILGIMVVLGIIQKDDSDNKDETTQEDFDDIIHDDDTTLEKDDETESKKGDEKTTKN